MASVRPDRVAAEIQAAVADLLIRGSIHDPRIGFITLTGVKVSPDGRVVSEGEWAQQASQWLPSAEDRAFVSSLMGRVVEPGKFANWIAPPPIGINKQAPDFEYIRFS